MLRDYLGEYSDVLSAKGKALELVLMSSLLLYSRSNVKFSPSIFCDVHHCSPELNEINLLGGNAVEIINVQRFPFCSLNNIKSVPSSEISELVSKVSPNSPGGVFIPKDNFNLYGDVFGIFRTDIESCWALLVFQCKDLFLDHVKRNNSKINFVNELKKYRKTLFPEDEINFTIDNMNKTLKVFHVLCSANELEEISYLQCTDSDGAGSLKTMRGWLPTAAFACEGAHKLREIFGKLPEE
jgi:hypothetical protein